MKNKTQRKHSEHGSAGIGLETLGDYSLHKFLFGLWYLGWNALIGSILQKKLHNL